MDKYSNPIKRHGDFADPFVLRYNGVYYLYCTNPDVRCWSSGNLVDWKAEGPTVPPDEFPGLVPFAPEVVYDNGKFYMYTSPHGLGHYVLSSDSPLGPFKKMTANIGRAIDFSVFKDDDGKWYAYWAGETGILGCEMRPPAEFGEPVLIGAYMHGWTEGPFMVKEGGKYYLTYTGNHFLSKGYRIHTAIGSHPLGPFTDSAYNPVVIRTEGGVVGLGHSSTVIGPDLVSRYIVYHNLNPDKTRDLNIDRIRLLPDGMYIQGPTDYAMPAPAMPAYFDDFRKPAPPEWTLLTGGWSAENGFRVSAGAFEAVCAEVLPRSGAAEFNLASRCAGAAPYGVLLAAEGRQLRIVLDRRENTFIVTENGCPVAGPVRLPDDFDHEALHCIRIVVGKASAVYLDQLRMAEVELPPNSHIGYFSGSGMRMGYTAISPEPDGAECYPVSCIIPADRVFLLNVPREADYTLAAVGGGDGRVKIDGVRIETAAYRRPRLRAARVHLGAGLHKIEAEGDSFSHYEVYEIPKAPRGELSVRDFGPFEKLAVLPAGLDVDLRACFSVSKREESWQAGVIFRASALADGGEGGDKALGTDFFIGYRVCIEENAICLYKHRYDETLLARVRGDISGEEELCISANGGTICVRRHGEKLIDYVDEQPILFGECGFHTRNAVISGRLRSAEGARVPAPDLSAQSPRFTSSH